MHPSVHQRCCTHAPSLRLGVVYHCFFAYFVFLRHQLPSQPWSAQVECLITDFVPFSPLLIVVACCVHYFYSHTVTKSYRLSRSSSLLWATLQLDPGPRWYGCTSFSLRSRRDLLVHEKSRWRSCTVRPICLSLYVSAHAHAHAHAHPTRHPTIHCPVQFPLFIVSTVSHR